MKREELDKYIDDGHSPNLNYITCADVPDFQGKLRECAAIYTLSTYFPKIVIGSYRKVIIILDVNKI